MKVKVSEATDNQINWMVAKCEGRHELAPFWVDDDKYGNHIERPFSPSTDWAQGGPIIERERIELCSYSNDGVETAFKSMGDERGNYSHEEEYVVSVPEVVVWTAWVKYGSYKQDGHTPLIAAMRCFVISRLGDEVEVPEELK